VGQSSDQPETSRDQDNHHKEFVGSFNLRTLVGTMVKGARCWSDEAEKTRFSSAQFKSLISWPGV